MMMRPFFRLLAIVGVVFGGYRAASKIGAFKEPNRNILPKYIHVFCEKLAKALDIKVVRLGEIPQHHALWVSNHISWVDVAAIGTSSPAFFLSRSDVADWPILGKLITAAGTLYIKRGSGDSGSVKNQIAEFLRQDISVLFFPEATTTNGKAVKNIHSKLLQAAIDTGVPVQPVVLCYVNKHGKLDETIPFIGDISFGAHLKQVIANDPATLYIKALEPLDPANFADKEDLKDALKLRMDAGLKALHDEVLR